MGIVIVRIFMLAAAAGAGLAFGPSLGFHATNWWLGGAGFLFGVLAVLLEWQARRIPESFLHGLERGVSICWYHYLWPFPFGSSVSQVAVGIQQDLFELFAYVSSLSNNAGRIKIVRW